MSSGDLTQRLIAGAEDANDDIANKSYHHTVKPAAPLPAEKTVAPSPNMPQSQSGADLHEILMQRARHKEHLEETLGDTRQFFDYKNSSVGNVGSDQELRRELTLRSQKERREREKRFGHKKRHSTRTATGTTTQNERQRFNATGVAGSMDQQTDSRQEFNTQTPKPRTTYREPPTRGYNPYA